MHPNSETARLIFGLKIRQLRIDKGIPASEVAKLSGLSPSYYNEIEKGKKYPKVEKIFDLARALDTDYETLVSLKLSKKLEPLAELLNSRILNELPLEWLGLDVYSLLELLWNAPSKVSAFISTIIEISRSYGMKVEGFFFSVLRTYQEIHDNYFPELEETAEELRKELGLQDYAALSKEELAGLLKNVFGYSIQAFTSQEYPEFTDLRSLYFPEKKLLLFNSSLTNQQKAFTFAREIGYQRLGISNRPLISSVMEAESFEQVMNNFKASYFSAALLLPRRQMVSKMEELFASETWQPERILSLLDTYSATPEMFIHRISGLLATHFGLNNLFFLRLNHNVGEREYFLTKEMHLSRLHSPHNTLAEHYCRRWVSSKVLVELSEQQLNKVWNGEALIRAQVSDYYESEDKYLVISIAYPSQPLKNVNSSLSVGIAINEDLKKVIRFVDDPAISRRIVNETCERCSIPDCLERVAAPVIYKKQIKLNMIKAKYSELRGGLE